MDPDFDPYFELLGIPKEEQPPNCYRLLGIPEYTSNKQVIANGAARQMQFLRRVGGDQYLTDVQKILNEISKVRITLLDDSKRAEYDRNLRAKERAKRGGESSGDSIADSPMQSQFDLSAPSRRDAGRPVAIQLLHLSGPRVGETLSLQTRDVSIGPSSKFDVMVPTRNNAKFKLELEIDQWTISSEETGFAINGRLVNGLAVLKDGDVVRLSVDGPDLQFIEEVDVTRHLDTLGEHQSAAEQSSPSIPGPAGYADVLRDSVQSGSISSSSPPRKQPPKSSSPVRALQPTRASSPATNPRNSKPVSANQGARTPARKESKLVKRPKSQRSQGLVGSVAEIANKALGRDKSFTKQKGPALDWQIGVFWLAVGGVLAAIAAGIIFGWR